MARTSYYKAAAELEREALHLGLLSSMSPRAARRLDNRLAWAAEAVPARASRTPKSQRARCGARTRKDTPCQARAVSGSNRCRLHGGLSTGPRTGTGREAIAESTRRRAVRADLEDLADDVAEDRRRQWAAAIVVLARDYPERYHDGDVRGAALAAEVSVRTIHRWRQHPGFAEAERRANVRRFRRWRRVHRREAREAEESMYTMPIESTCIDLDALLADVPDVEELLAGVEIPEIEDLDVAALLADVEAHLAELPTIDLEKLLEDIGNPLEGLELPDVEDLT